MSNFVGELHGNYSSAINMLVYIFEKVKESGRRGKLISYFETIYFPSSE
jgi:hypothetical protein